jgi:HEAT repeat protein
MTVVRDGAAALADAPFAVNVLALKDADRNVREVAIRSLQMLKDKRAVAYLVPLLEDETVLHSVIRDGIKTTHRPCDSVVLALEYIVNGKYVLPDRETQEMLDARVKTWRAWWKEKGVAFDESLYAEPELVRARE